MSNAMVQPGTDRADKIKKNHSYKLFTPVSLVSCVGFGY